MATIVTDVTLRPPNLGADMSPIKGRNDPAGDLTQQNDKSPGFVRIGAVAYLNTKPLIYGLEERLLNCGSLQLQLPSRLATALQNNSIDVGLIPVVEYFRHAHRYRVVSDAVIACRGPVWSVRVFFRKPPEQVRTLAIDEGSRSSVALAKILFHARFGSIPETSVLPIDAGPTSSSADAVLVIGDRAMRAERYRGAFCIDWDLGQEWFIETGLPFVFAMWIARDASFNTCELSCLLSESRDQGCAHMSEIVDRYATAYSLTDAECHEYLTRYLRFRFGDEERAGLAEYHRRCIALDLVPANVLP